MESNSMNLHNRYKQKMALLNHQIPSARLSHRIRLVVMHNSSFLVQGNNCSKTIFLYLGIQKICKSNCCFVFCSNVAYSRVMPTIIQLFMLSNNVLINLFLVPLDGQNSVGPRSVVTSLFLYQSGGKPVTKLALQRYLFSLSQSCGTKALMK